MMTRPGAMRYTECRLAVIANEMLVDIEKQVVDFQPNYKDSLEEPIVLPGLLPNLLVNGTTGIGVGYLTRIPPHNLTEVVDALLHKLSDPDATSEVLMEHIPDPTFPPQVLLSAPVVLSRCIPPVGEASPSGPKRS